MCDAASLAAVGLRRVDHLDPSHVDALMRMYTEEWWTSTRTRDDVDLMLERTALVIGLAEFTDDELVAFARVVTDGVYHGTLLDVIVRLDRRGLGYGDALMRTVLDDAALSQLRTLGLKCRDNKVAFYERWGFEKRSQLPSVEGVGSGFEMVRKHSAVYG